MQANKATRRGAHGLYLSGESRLSPLTLSSKHRAAGALEHYMSSGRADTATTASRTSGGVAASRPIQSNLYHSAS